MLNSLQAKHRGGLPLLHEHSAAVQKQRAELRARSLVSKALGRTAAPEHAHFKPGPVWEVASGALGALARIWVLGGCSPSVRTKLNEVAMGRDTMWQAVVSHGCNTSP